MNINILLFLFVGILLGALITYFYGHIPIIFYVIVLLISMIILPMIKKSKKKKGEQI